MKFNPYKKGVEKVLAMLKAWGWGGAQKGLG